MTSNQQLATPASEAPRPSALSRGDLHPAEVHAAVQSELALDEVGAVADPSPHSAANAASEAVDAASTRELLERQETVERVCGLLERLSDGSHVASVEVCCLAYLLAERAGGVAKVDGLGRLGFARLEWEAYRARELADAPADPHSLKSKSREFARRLLATDWAQSRLLTTWQRCAAHVRATSGVRPGRPTWCSVAAYRQSGGEL